MIRRMLTLTNLLMLIRSMQLVVFVKISQMQSECLSADSEYSYAASPFSLINKYEDIPNSEIENIRVNISEECF